MMRCAAQRTSTRLGTGLSIVCVRLSSPRRPAAAAPPALGPVPCTLAFNSLSLLLRAVSKAVENYWNDVLEIITLVLKATKMMGFMVVHYDVKDFDTQKVC